MSDKILQHVLSDLRPHILSKLKTEADSLTGASSTSTQKKAVVDTHRGDTYQFCYFIRKTEPHSVVIKSRSFRTAPPRKSKGSELAPPPSKKRGIRNEPFSSPNKRKKQKMGDQPVAEAIDDSEDMDMVGPDDGGDDVGASQMHLEMEEEEEKPKPILSLRYQGFSIYGHCLCVVVEPWPVMRTTTVAPVFSRTTITPSRGVSGLNVREKTPLFLPEDLDQPALPEDGSFSHLNQLYLRRILNDGEAEDEEDDGGMLEFSQLLQNVGDSRAGAINDDNDVDGSILFGDADEFREL